MRLGVMVDWLSEGAQQAFVINTLIAAIFGVFIPRLGFVMLTAALLVLIFLAYLNGAWWWA